MTHEKVCSIRVSNKSREERGSGTRQSHMWIDFPFPVLCLEKKKLIRLAGVKLRAEQGRALALDRCSGLWKVTASQAAPDSKVTSPWQENVSDRRTRGLICWLAFGSCVIQKGNRSSWGSGWGTYLRGGHNAGRLPSRWFCGIKLVSEELRATVGVKVRLSRLVLQGTLPKMKCSRWQLCQLQSPAIK